ncbi:glycosyltransferase family 2 protein [Hydrogenophaga sp.]|uniref:glycosyltransferase family 2 protein n=1 Tax=Hydrogenophaga sp. TaxID=1904254 RepID=UPI0027315E30|nr:glycosyltransferase family 2 protein [Hydrogenophaga sp.]MDP2073005.1 glycosyltransferase family 2 protein [Hydrogenophaga sp.]
MSDGMPYRLSICIPTLNRANYIGETLQSIISQWEEGVEIVIVDGGSIDDTERVVRSFQQNLPHIRYIKADHSETKPSNQGFDRDCDHAVVLAKGEHCWLMTDDDLIWPGALRKVMAAATEGHDLIVANAEVRNVDFKEVLVRKRLTLPQDTVYKATDWNEFARAVGSHLTFVGAVIIRRSVWISRDREKYFGSGFVHVGVIFDQPIRGTILATEVPLVSIRFGNAQWTSRAFQIWLINWPELIWSFKSLSDQAKSGISAREPWRSLKTLLFNRAMGMYSAHEYTAFVAPRPNTAAWHAMARVIAVIPRVLLYVPVWLYIRTKLPNRTYVLFNLKESWKKK